MKFLEIACLALFGLGGLQAQDFSLLDDRKWTSTDRNVLEATLVKYEGDWITLKRRTDNKEFKLPITRLGVEDRGLLEKTTKELQQIIDASDGRPAGAGMHFTGFSNPGEKVWELAHRIGLHRKLWDQACGATWFNTIAGSHRVIRIKPQRFERISDVEYFIHGEYVSLKVRLDELEEKLSLSGGKLVRATSSGKKTIAQEDVDFAPALRKENLLSLSIEKVGVVERLVMSISLGRSFP